MNPMLYGALMASSLPQRNYNANLTAAISNGLDMGNKNAQSLFAVLNSNNQQESNRSNARSSTRAVVSELINAFQSGHLEKDSYKKDWPRLSETFTYDELERLFKQFDQTESEIAEAAGAG